MNPGFKNESTLSIIRAPGSEPRTCSLLDLTDLGSFASDILGLGMMVVEAKEEGADPRGEVEACTQAPWRPGSLTSAIPRYRHRIPSNGPSAAPAPRQAQEMEAPPLFQV